VKTRRTEREIKDKSEIESIISRATVARIGLCRHGIPYVVPVNFGYQDGRLYFHSATQGKKIEIIRQNNRVCFEMDIDQELVKSENPCKYGMKYRSVIGFGRASLIDDFAGKRKALNIITGHYLDGFGEFDREQIENTAVIKIEIESMSGKKSRY
jgi:nitroimidazol reductase NimA-like FMN-containing flavoprotein (pyridoxamine 5'-phosphate oxidase superfamily)